MTSRRSRAAAIVIAGSLSLFAVVFALLVFQLRAGRDPALSASTAAQPVTPPVRRIIHRRIIIRKVIVHVRPREDDGAVPALTTTVAPAPRAPATARPAPAAPAPAPAPAPLTTRSS